MIDQLGSQFVDLDWDDLDMPSTPGFYAQSIVFIYRTLEGAQKDTGFCAVGFIVGVRSCIRSTHRYYYLITNEHVVREFDTITVRINGVLGFRFLQIQKRNFQTDKNLDLAITALPEDSQTTFTFISEDVSVKPEIANQLKIGYGTDVFMVSRVVRPDIPYLNRNLAVLRFGNIAMPPAFEEPFYLTEMRSIAGHSGSPVFVYPTPFIFGSPRKKKGEDFAPMLLGINCGHLEETEAIVRIVNGSTVEHPQFRSVANIAIAQVVPAWHIFKMLEGKKFKLQRQKADGKLVREVNFIKDKKTRDFLHVPKGNVKMLKADGSVEISDATPEQKARRKIMRSISEKSKSEQ